MHTGYTQQVQEFDLFFIKNYKLLHSKINYLWKSALTEEERTDYLHNSYIKIKKRITASGYTGSNYMAYTFRTLRFDMMQYHNQKKVKNKKRFVDFDNEELQGEINEMLLKENLFSNNQNYYEQLVILVRLLFEFLDKRYSSNHTFVFKTYYLTSSNSYKKLQETTGYSFNTIKNIISNIKKDIKTNFITYVKEKMKDNVDNYL